MTIHSKRSRYVPWKQKRTTQHLTQTANVLDLSTDEAPYSGHVCSGLQGTQTNSLGSRSSYFRERMEFESHSTADDSGTFVAKQTHHDVQSGDNGAILPRHNHHLGLKNLPWEAMSCPPKLPRKIRDTPEPSTANDDEIRGWKDRCYEHFSNRSGDVDAQELRDHLHEGISYIDVLELRLKEATDHICYLESKERVSDGRRVSRRVEEKERAATCEHFESQMHLANSLIQFVRTSAGPNEHNDHIQEMAQSMNRMSNLLQTETVSFIDAYSRPTKAFWGIPRTLPCAPILEHSVPAHNCFKSGSSQKALVAHQCRPSDAKNDTMVQDASSQTKRDGSLSEWVHDNQGLLRDICQVVSHMKYDACEKFGDDETNLLLWSEDGCAELSPSFMDKPGHSLRTLLAACHRACTFLISQREDLLTETVMLLENAKEEGAAAALANSSDTDSVSGC